MHKSCYTIFNAPKFTPHPDLAVTGQLLRYESKHCYKAEQNSIMLQKASRASYALRSMIDSIHPGIVEKSGYRSLEI